MKDPVTLLEKINNIDDDLIEEAGKDTSEFAPKSDSSEDASLNSRRKKDLKRVIVILAAAIVLSAGVVTFFALVPPNGSTKSQDAAPDTSSADGSTAVPSGASWYLSDPMTYEEILASSDLLLIGTCAKGETVVVDENTIPKSIYDDFTFSIDRVLCGEYDASEITLRMRHQDARVLWPDETNQNLQAYREGHQYLLLIKRWDLKDGTAYTFAVPSLNLDLTIQSFRFPYGKPQIPDGQSLEDYSIQVFNEAKK